MDHPSANTDARTPSSLGPPAEPSTRDSHAEDNSSSCLTAYCTGPCMDLCSTRPHLTAGCCRQIDQWAARLAVPI